MQTVIPEPPKISAEALFFAEELPYFAEELPYSAKEALYFAEEAKKRQDLTSSPETLIPTGVMACWVCFQDPT